VADWRRPKPRPQRPLSPGQRIGVVDSISTTATPLVRWDRPDVALPQRQDKREWGGPDGAAIRRSINA
jgi:hypothetical protein